MCVWGGVGVCVGVCVCVFDWFQLRISPIDLHNLYVIALLCNFC